MKWTPARVRPGTLRTIRRFAWLPTRMSGRYGPMVWLAFYLEAQVRERQVERGRDGKTRAVERWVMVGREVPS